MIISIIYGFQNTLLLTDYSFLDKKSISSLILIYQIIILENLNINKIDLIVMLYACKNNQEKNCIGNGG